MRENYRAFRAKVGESTNEMDVRYTPLFKSLIRLNRGVKKAISHDDLRLYDEKLKNMPNAAHIVEAEIGLHDYYPSLKELIQKINNCNNVKTTQSIDNDSRHKRLYEAEQNKFVMLWEKYEKIFGRDELFNYCNQHLEYFFGSKEARDWVPKQMRIKFFKCSIFDLERAGTMENAYNLAREHARGVA